MPALALVYQLQGGKSGRITHLLMVEGHLWSKKEIVVPVSEIDHYEQEVDVHLKLTKDPVKFLPIFDEKRQAS